MQHKNTGKLEIFSDRLRALAKRSGLSQVAIAKKLGLPASRVGNWFQGKNFPKPQDQQRLIQLLNTSVEYLIDGGSSETFTKTPFYYNQRSFVENFAEEPPPRKIVDYVLEKLPRESLFNRFIQILYDDTRTAEERIQACKLLLRPLAKRWPPEKNSNEEA